MKPLRVRYTKQDGTLADFELTERPVTIGRNPEADIIVADERVSRVHCGIRLWDGEHFLKDLKSKNGTFVNGQRVDVHKLVPGDVIRIGSSNLTVEEESAMGPNTALHEIGGQMESGKGYSTILKEIVGDEKPAAGAKKPPAEAAKKDEELEAGSAAGSPRIADEAPAADSQSTPLGPKVRKKVRIVLKKKPQPPSPS